MTKAQSAAGLAESWNSDADCCWVWMFDLRQGVKYVCWHPDFYVDYVAATST